MEIKKIGFLENLVVSGGALKNKWFLFGKTMECQFSLRKWVEGNYNLTISASIKKVLQVPM